MCCFYEAKTIQVKTDQFPPEPERDIAVATLREKHAGQACPICVGYGWLKCATCDGRGTEPFLGGVQECRACRGGCVRKCMVCQGRGEIKQHQQPLTGQSRELSTY